MPPNALVRLVSKISKVGSVSGSVDSTSGPSKDDVGNTYRFGLFRLHYGDRTKLEENATSTSRSREVEIVSDTGDIVAIHGLGGSAYKTWTHENGLFWLQDVALNEFPGARIYTFGYDSGFAFSNGTGTLRDFAKSLLEAIKLERATSEVHFSSNLLLSCLAKTPGFAHIE
jgi:hypothetical protein